MESKIHQISKSAYAVIGPEGATNFGIVKATDGSAVLVDADIRRIDQVEEALRLIGCAKVGYLVNTHEHFDHTSANYYFEAKGRPHRGERRLCARDEGGRRTGLRANAQAGAGILRPVPGSQANLA